MLGRLVKRMNDAFHESLSGPGLAQSGVTPAQKLALVHLATEGSRISDLARRLGVSKQAASKVVQEMEAADLVTRRSDPLDHRATIITFADRGRRILDETIAHSFELEMRLKDRFGEEDVEEFRRLLIQFSAFLDPEGF